MKYSDDRLSLAQEIKETLESRGFWVPKDWAGPDLIMAVAKALDKNKEHVCSFPEEDIL